MYTLTCRGRRFDFAVDPKTGDIYNTDGPTMIRFKGLGLFLTAPLYGVTRAGLQICAGEVREAFHSLLLFPALMFCALTTVIHPASGRIRYGRWERRLNSQSRADGKNSFSFFYLFRTGIHLVLAASRGTPLGKVYRSWSRGCRGKRFYWALCYQPKTHVADPGKDRALRWHLQELHRMKMAFCYFLPLPLKPSA